jgi:hypothetical protein
MHHMWLELEIARVSNHRLGVDAGWPLLFAPSRSWPRATQAGRCAPPDIVGGL